MMNDTDLDNLRSDKRFKAVLAKVKKVGDYLDILQKTPGYTTMSALIHSPASNTSIPTTSI